jgi:hypothetical protein
MISGRKVQDSLHYLLEGINKWSMLISKSIVLSVSNLHPGVTYPCDRTFQGQRVRRDKVRWELQDLKGK